MKRRVGVLISGRGSNLAALLRAAADPTWPAEIALVLSNRPDAAGLGIATEAGMAIAPPTRTGCSPASRRPTWKSSVSPATCAC
jgi:folate-dependent phosphoribosylglycinamide formyltransferase PurN